ncbi:MAG: hypothetical protein Q4A96_03475 [Candidatus Saccharibacteria bacterium]|nr:hypothetical protein [Candidatus Saccharibacteria bacterium]
MDNQELPQIQVELRDKALALAKNYDETSNEFKKYNAIAKILSESNCFSYIPMERAYAMLRDLGVEEDKFGEVYGKLV